MRDFRLKLGVGFLRMLSIDVKDMGTYMHLKIDWFDDQQVLEFAVAIAQTFPDQVVEVDLYDKEVRVFYD